MSERKIDAKNNLYTKNLSKWQLIDDICDNENVENYILELNPTDKSAENVERNRMYKARAIFAAFAGFTARGLVGMLFRKWPKLNVPELLKYVSKNVDGAGNSIYQQSQMVARQQVRNGRAGLLVDYPLTENTATVADQKALRIFATIQKFTARQIYDWAFVSVGAQIKISRVVLGDTIEENGTEIDIIRELLLLDGVYVSREWRCIEGDWVQGPDIIPKDGKEQPWDEIPFIFVGSETNTYTIDPAPMYDICKLNIGHYRNSADYEDMAYHAGQAMFYVTGMTVQHAKEIEEAGIKIGSGRMFPVPPGETAGIVQVASDSILSEAMGKKESMAIGLGAMFIQPGSAVKTATQAEGEQQVQHSVLSLIASNLSEAYTQCLKWVAMFMNVDGGECEYTVQQDFIPKSADAQMYLALLSGVNAGTTPISDFITWQQKHMLIDPEKTTEEVMEEFGPVAAMPNLNLGEDE